MAKKKTSKKGTIKKEAKKVGRKAKKMAKTDVGRAGIGGGIGALALGPIGAVAGAGIAMATKKKKNKKKAAKKNPDKMVKVSYLVGSLMLDYERITPALREAGAMAIEKGRVPFGLLSQARRDLAMIHKGKRAGGEKDQIEDTIDAIDYILKKSKSIKNPGRSGDHITYPNAEEYKIGLESVSDNVLNKEYEVVKKQIAYARSKGHSKTRMNSLVRTREIIVNERKRRRQGNPGSSSGTPANKLLYAQVVREAKNKFDVWPSIYASSWVVQEYKRRGGRYINPLTGLDKWYAEKWVDLGRSIDSRGRVKKWVECGRPKAGEGSYPKCVPLEKAKKMTPAERLSAVRRKRAAESHASQKKGRPPIMVRTNPKSKKATDNRLRILAEDYKSKKEKYDGLVTDPKASRARIQKASKELDKSTETIASFAHINGVSKRELKKALE